MFKKLILLPLLSFSVLLFVHSSSEAIQVDNPSPEPLTVNTDSPISLSSEPGDETQPLLSTSDSVQVLDEEVSAELEPIGLETQKTKCIESCKESLLRQDQQLNNPILDVVAKLLQPLCEGQKCAPGGQERIDHAMSLLDQLLTIHKNKALRSPEKHEALGTLLIEAMKLYNKVIKQPKGELHPYHSRLNHPELVQFEQRLIETSYSGVGGKISLGTIVGLGVGGSVGISTDACGGRQWGLATEAFGMIGLTIGASAGAGYYELTPNDRNLYSYTSVSTSSLGLGVTTPGQNKSHSGFNVLCGILPQMIHSGTDLKRHKAYEGVIGVILGPQGDCRIGRVWNLKRVRRDYEHFYRNVGLTAQSATLPDDVLKQVNEATSLVELKTLESM